jgi:hypothetical protein
MRVKGRLFHYEPGRAYFACQLQEHSGTNRYITFIINYN